MSPFTPLSRRRWLLGAAAVGATAAAEWLPGAPLATLARAADGFKDFFEGPPVKDYPLRRISPRVWMVWTPDGFPTPENQGMMSNVVFVVTRDGVVVLDSGGSLQIGQMAIRRIKTVTDKPVVAVFNSHYHGDHWLGNHAFRDAFGASLPIYALPACIDEIAGVQGNLWRSLLERWTNGATLGTKVVVPNRPAAHGQELRFGDTTLRLHHYGVAHTPCDLSVEVVEDGVTYVGDVAMHRRIANMDDGSYLGTFRYFDALEKNTKSQIWVPGHGDAGPNLLRENRELFEGIYRPCEQAVKDGVALEQAKALVLADPRVKKYAGVTQGFESNIGKYTSIAYLEAEKEAF